MCKLKIMIISICFKAAALQRTSWCQEVSRRCQEHLTYFHWLTMQLSDTRVLIIRFPFNDPFGSFQTAHLRFECDWDYFDYMQSSLRAFLNG